VGRWEKIPDEIIINFSKLTSGTMKHLMKLLLLQIPFLLIVHSTVKYQTDRTNIFVSDSLSMATPPDILTF